MQKNELNYYDNLGNWDFSKIKYKTEKVTDWDFYDKIKENTNENSLCLDIGTGGGEKVLKYYPNVGMIIATDFSNEMIKTANENLKGYPDKNVRFAYMDNMDMKFPNELFDLVSARHTVINAKQIYSTLKEGGVLVIEGIDKKDCWDLKELFKRGQAFNDAFSIAEQDYNDLKDAGFSKIEQVEIYENEHYETEDDLMALLLKVPIIDDFSEINNENFVHKTEIEKDLFDEYVKKNKTDRGIILRRVLYGIVAKK